MKNTNLKDIFTRWNTLLLAVLFIFISTTESNAQYKPNQEFGILGGTGYYIGDMNSTHFNNLRVAGGITYRKNFDRRFTFKSSALYTNVYANDENSNI